MKLTPKVILMSLLVVLTSAFVMAANTTTAQESSVSQGEVVYMARCEYCHGDGPQKGGTMMLQRRYQGSRPAVLHQRTDLVAEYVRAIVRTNTPGMTPIRITEVSEQELDALIAYLTRNNPD